ncbi:MAG: Uma2 family endonuclease [Selenomonadaceae bacterium]|nr:Uma2 family endonuclease [Selenomonadaceae bacterium]
MDWNEEFGIDLDDEGVKYEMINGVQYGEPRYEIIGGEKIYMAAAAPNLDHATVVSRLHFIFLHYVISNNINAAVFHDNTDLIFAKGENFMADVCIVLNPEIVKTHKKILGAPDLIVEVLSDSTKKRDRGIKKDTYEKYGVREYWIADYESKSIEVYHLIENKYNLAGKYKVGTADDKIKVSIFDNLIVDINQVFKWWFDD